MTKSNTTFIITGGAGRVIAAVPALEKFARLNPDDDFKVLVYGWESLFWSHPLLQDRTFSIVIIIKSCLWPKRLTLKSTRHTITAT